MQQPVAVDTSSKQSLAVRVAGSYSPRSRRVMGFLRVLQMVGAAHVGLMVRATALTHRQCSKASGERRLLQMGRLVCGSLQLWTFPVQQLLLGQHLARSRVLPVQLLAVALPLA
jgi:hypothetical protein